MVGAGLCHGKPKPLVDVAGLRVRLLDLEVEAAKAKVRRDAEDQERCAIEQVPA